MPHRLTPNPFLPLSVNSGAGITPSTQSLSGLRVAVKDLFHMAGLPTTAGNPTWLATHAIPEQNRIKCRHALGGGC